MAGDQTKFERWVGELDNARKDEAYKRWLDRSTQIIKRYRDERKNSTAEFGKRRYNILWSNVETLKGAVYGKMPKPIAERRFLDRDPAARLASLILERTLDFQLQVGGFNSSSKKGIKDRLLPGMGVMWQRYEPQIEAEQLAKENAEVESEETDDSAAEIEDDGTGSVYEKLSFERVCFDYVFYRDLLWSPSRSWDEVPWIARRCYMDKSEAEEAFGADIAKKMVFGDAKNPQSDQIGDREPLTLGRSKKAEVWEIWSKPDRYVCFIAPQTVGVILKEEYDDPLKLEGFFPCQEPLWATQTNDTIVPIPDYVEYQDQAAELDTLTDRISFLTTAIKVAGVYNSAFPELARILQDGADNKLIAVADWAAFAEKNGLPGAISLIDIKPMQEALETLYDMRDRVKSQIDELTGISDIIRGVSDPQETATAQQIKSNYASGRLRTRQEEVALWCVGSIRIAAEIVCEIFSDDSLRQMSGVDQLFADEVRQAIEAVAQPPQPAAPSPNSGQPDPTTQASLVAHQGQLARQQAAQAKQQEQEQRFAQALKILRSDKLRGFRVDIETDSTIADELQQDKAAVTEYMTGLFQSLESAEQIIQAAPELLKPLGQTILMAARKMRVGRTLESAWEDALDQLEQRMEQQKNQPKPPDPDMIKAQASAEVAQANVQATEARSQAETQKAQADLRIQEIQFQSDQAEAGLKTKIAALQLQLDAHTSQEDTLTARQKSFLSYLQAVRVAEIAAGQATDESQVDAKIEALLGFANIAHEATQNALDRQHAVNMASQQQTHDQTMQDNAPEPA